MNRLPVDRAAEIAEHLPEDLAVTDEERERAAAALSRVFAPEEVVARVAEFRRMLMIYRFGVDEVMTKISILRDEYRHLHVDNPIEHTKSRIKSFESILDKARRKGIELSPASIRSTIQDIAGVRVTCSFVSDIYRVRDAITAQRDVTVLEERDYIRHPKPNGYKSLHLIVQVPVFLSDRTEDVVVEIQLRTIAMDFWASLEHKIFYKYDKAVPRELTDTLKLAADVAAQLDTTMENLHDEIRGVAEASPTPSVPASLEEMAEVFTRALAAGPLAPPD